MLDIRTGFGIDIHEFSKTLEDNQKLFLCGIQIPYRTGLKGHSDADVVLHALCDAIYGALGMGDIGDYFPPSDQKWKGCDSVVFLKHAVESLHTKLAKINNVDITILAEAPKISPYKQQMKEFLQEYLQINIDRINIKATTAEKLGFIGRAEGILATAAVSVIVDSQ